MRGQRAHRYYVSGAEFRTSLPYLSGNERKEAERVSAVPAAQEARFLEEPTGETKAHNL